MDIRGTLKDERYEGRAIKGHSQRITGIDVRREMHPFCLFSDQARIKDGVCAKKKEKGIFMSCALFDSLFLLLYPLCGRSRVHLKMSYVSTSSQKQRRQLKVNVAVAVISAVVA